MIRRDSALSWGILQRFLGLTIPLSLIVGCSAPLHAIDKLSELDMSNHVDSSVTAAKIAGNPLKYVGYTVKLRCTINNIPSPDFANATCGPKSDDFDIPSTANVDFTDPTAIARFEQTEEATFAKSAEALREQGILVLQGHVGSFDANQVVTILGTVDQPMAGKNGMGVEQNFPTVRIAYIITSNSSSMIQSRVDTQKSCIRHFRSKMNARPRRNHKLTNNDIDKFFDQLFDGVLQCDVSNGFAFMPSDEIEKISSGESYSAGNTVPTPLPSAPPKDSPISIRIAYQAGCMKYIAAYYPWYLRQNRKKVQQEAAGVAVDLFGTLEDCDYLGGLDVVDVNEVKKWAEKALE